MSNKILKIMTLYNDEMNIYGDYGNLLTLQKRCQWHGIETKHIKHEPSKEFDLDVDIILGGGGQDSGQNKIQADLIKNSSNLHQLTEDGVPMLLICGMYQLFGHYFETNTGNHINGIGIFDAWTKAGPTRLIGNIVTEISLQSHNIELVGYENHSGLTYLNKEQSAFAKVIKGAGNNGSDKTEGARTNNVFGSYLHGPILPKNPEFTDELIRLAMIKKYDSFTPKDIDDSIAIKALSVSASHPR